VLVLEHDVDNALAGRLDLWFDAYAQPGSVYLPLVMVDSGHAFTNGDLDFVSVYGDMIDAALLRPAAADMTVTSERIGNLLRLGIRITNRSGAALSAADDSSLTALVWTEPSDPSAIPVVAGGGSTAVTTLADGETGDFTLEVTVPDLDPSRTRWVVIAHHRSGSGSAHDTLQAVLGPE
jgi:hypothetical protein